MKEFLKKVWAWIVAIPQDKLLHDYAGALIALFGFVLTFLFLPFWWAFLCGNLLALAALIAKEIYDAKHAGHSCECEDIAFGLFGIAKVDVALLLLAISVL